MKKSIQFTSIIVCILGLLSCRLNPKDASTVPSQANAESILVQSHNAEGTQKYYYKLQAAQVLLSQGRLKKAKTVLDQVPNEAFPIKKRLLVAHLNVLQNRPDQAQTSLSKINNVDTLPKDTKYQYLTLNLQAALKRHDFLGLFKTAQALEPHLNKPQRAELHKLLWQQLAWTPISKLQKALNEADPTTAGWLKLSLISKQDANDAQFKKAVQEWQATHPKHPANHFIKPNANADTDNQFRTVALLLPLHGKLAPYGRAIRDAFLAHYYQHQNSHTMFVTVTVNIIDTSQKSILQQYQKAIDRGADFIIGPLQKTNIKTLADHGNISIPTLALNHIDGLDAPSNLYQFGLQTDHQAEQAALRASSEGAKNALLIGPKNTWGHRVLAHFQTQWQKNHGHITQTLHFTKHQQALANQISAALGTQQSHSRALKLERQLGQRFKSQSRRRHDIDMVFVAAIPQDARQIRPLLKFYYADNIPVYATGSIYQGSPNPKTDQDLNGIQFCDIPWVIVPEKALPQDLANVHHHIQNTMPKQHHRYPKLTALGADAYHIFEHFNILRQYPKFPIPAATGLLQRQPDGTIKALLPCAQIRNGRPHLLTPTSTLFKNDD